MFDVKKKRADKNLAELSETLLSGVKFSMAKTVEAITKRELEKKEELLDDKSI